MELDMTKFSANSVFWVMLIAPDRALIKAWVIDNAIIYNLNNKNNAKNII